MQGTQWNDYHPIASVDSYHAPIEFVIPPHTEFYNDFSLVLIDFSLTVKAATLIFIYGRGSAISSAEEGESGSIYNLVKN